jgi:beta-aspartyl-peptidase (threonine type)
MKKMALAVHGGAGTILKSLMTHELEAEYRAGLTNALQIGWRVLEQGGSALDAVEATVVELENFPLFNAGKGSVFTHAGKNEMDASIMDGSNLKAGAVAFVKNVKNPIRLARLVMERTEHILLGGDGADEFAREMGVELEPDEYFFTGHRYKQLQEAMESDRVQLDHSIKEPDLIERSTNSHDRKSQIENRKSLGTVGAVACDSAGNIAAATSTGGMTNKKFGRIGDTPLIGSGTYADNATCAVSCTGHGEYFMIGATAYDVAARMKYKGLSLENAAKESIDYLTTINGEGGLIAVDALGNITMPFNSEGMYRGRALEGNITVEIYKELSPE